MERLGGVGVALPRSRDEKPLEAPGTLPGASCHAGVPAPTNSLAVAQQPRGRAHHWAGAQGPRHRLPELTCPGTEASPAGSHLLPIFGALMN